MRVRHLLIRSAALALLLTLTACASPKDVTGSLPDDYRARHPIYVTRGAATLDLLPGGGPGGLTDRQVGDIQQFAGDWRKRGRGQLVVHVPTGGDAVADRQSAQAAKEIRRILSAMGISGRAVSTRRYAADGPEHLAPVRLEFPVLEAKVPHECGQWPDDFGYSDPGASNRNRSDWSFGCAYQQNLAAQVEDPEDFIRPRAETPASATRRADVIGKFGKGEPTVTAYPKPTIVVPGAAGGE
jgi:pilus assembly protein CpaD